MQSAYKIKKKLPSWALMLLILVAVAVVALVTLHFTGVIDLSFLPTSLTYLYMWSSADITNSVLTTIGLVAGGVLLYYVIQKYFVGQKMLAPVAQTYAPQAGLTPPSLIQTDSNTVVEKTSN